MNPVVVVHTGIYRLVLYYMDLRDTGHRSLSFASRMARSFPNLACVDLARACSKRPGTKRTGVTGASQYYGLIELLPISRSEHFPSKDKSKDSPLYPSNREGEWNPKLSCIAILDIRHNPISALN